MTAREKVIFVEQQVLMIMEGSLDQIICPFCSLPTTPETGALCCDSLAEVVNAVLDHSDHIQRKEVLERAMNRLRQMESSQVVLQ